MEDRSLCFPNAPAQPASCSGRETRFRTIPLDDRVSSAWLEMGLVKATLRLPTIRLRNSIHAPVRKQPKQPQCNLKIERERRRKRPRQPARRKLSGKGAAQLRGKRKSQAGERTDLLRSGPNFRATKQRISRWRPACRRDLRRSLRLSRRRPRFMQSRCPVPRPLCEMTIKAQPRTCSRASVCSMPTTSFLSRALTANAACLRFFVAPR